MSDIIDEVYPIFLDAGYTPSLFWDSSLGEVIDLINSNARREQARAEEHKMLVKENIILNSVLARQVSEYVSLYLVENTSITPLHKFFPDLFDDEDNNSIDTALMVNKAKMEEFAYRHNLKRSKEKR